MAPGSFVQELVSLRLSVSAMVNETMLRRAVLASVPGLDQTQIVAIEYDDSRRRLLAQPSMRALSSTFSLRIIFRAPDINELIEQLNEGNGDDVHGTEGKSAKFAASVSGSLLEIAGVNVAVFADAIGARMQLFILPGPSPPPPSPPPGQPPVLPPSPTLPFPVWLLDDVPMAEQ